MRSFFLFRIIGILEHAKTIRQKNEYCKNCELLKENKCKRYQLCLKVLSDILDDHPSNTSKKIEKIIEYTSQIPGGNIINVVYKNAPKNKPRKFIRLSKDWNKKIEILSQYEYRKIANKLNIPELEPQSPWSEDNKTEKSGTSSNPFLVIVNNYKNGKEYINKLNKLANDLANDKEYINKLNKLEKYINKLNKLANDKDKLAKKLPRLTHSTPQKVETIADRILWNHQKIQRTSKKIHKKHISKKPKKFMKHRPQR